VLRHIPNVKEPEMPALDLTGFALTDSSVVLMLAVGPRAISCRETSPRLHRPGRARAVGLSAAPRPHAHPVIDLSLFRLPTFRTGVLAGSLFRIGVGATPFLLPLLLQLGFG